MKLVATALALLVLTYSLLAIWGSRPAHASDANRIELLLDDAEAWVERASSLENVDRLDHLAEIVSKVPGDRAAAIVIELRATAQAERVCRADRKCMTDRVIELKSERAEAEVYEANAKACIARENSNPAHVRNLVALFQCGNDLRAAQTSIGLIDASLIRAKRILAAQEAK